MSKLSVGKNLVIEEIAERNPLIDADLFKEWQRRMDIIKRIPASEPPRESAERTSTQRIPLSTFNRRSVRN